MLPHSWQLCCLDACRDLMHQVETDRDAAALPRLLERTYAGRAFMLTREYRRWARKRGQFYPDERTGRGIRFRTQVRADRLRLDSEGRTARCDWRCPVRFPPVPDERPPTHGPDP